MLKLYRKIRDSWAKSILLSCLFLVIFLVLFYLANLDLKPAPKNSSSNEALLVMNGVEEIQKRLGSTEFSSLGYADWVKSYGLTGDSAGLDSDPDGDGLPNYLEYVHLTSPIAADTDGDGFSDKQEITNGYDPDAPGEAKPSVEVSIDKIKVDAPMVWSLGEDEKTQLEDLKKGVVHFPKTAAPGQIGNMIISGHSSNYIWADGNYNYIFKDLNNLTIGDTVSIKTVQKNGRIIVYHYVVTDKQIVAPDDQKIFENSPTPTMTLSTCWPLGTALKRIIVKAELVK